MMERRKKKTSRCKRTAGIKFTYLYLLLPEGVSGQTQNYWSSCASAGPVQELVGGPGRLRVISSLFQFIQQGVFNQLILLRRLQGLFGCQMTGSLPDAARTEGQSPLQTFFAPGLFLLFSYQCWGIFLYSPGLHMTENNCIIIVISTNINTIHLYVPSLSLSLSRSMAAHPEPGSARGLSSPHVAPGWCRVSINNIGSVYIVVPWDGG